ncbi:MAG: phosphoribosylformylglycinamidine synthase subunit PurL [Dehalococcoidia bacterium]|nr:phosphoribosylformylglycinamidine synthase subunit PurL [Dehalococcoidia bacterium]
MPVSREVLDEIALSEKEYQLIVQRLGREPTEVELGMFGSLWSEHCGYKHSKLLLRRFPSRSRRVRTKVGEENAGAVDIGDGLAVVMKIESHNHPSAIEPFQGAATGVGGIVRDIFTMGARPIALLNSLRFGPLEEPRNRYLFEGVVGGIASYGNCLGIPDVGGEVYFSPVYSGNPLVNAMCVGLADPKKLISARAGGAGNPVMLVGADTGRDGLHGASGLASRTFEEVRELRSAVQVGNPFLEKLLIEACLQLAETDWIVGMQDLGAAGLTSASVESADRGGVGIEIDVLRVPRREEGMTPYEVMLSESQERMLVVVKRGYEEKVRELFQRWDLRCDIVGQVTTDGLVRVKEGNRVVAELPTKLLVNPPLYTVECRKPAWLTRLQKTELDQLDDVAPAKVGDVLLQMLAFPTIASKEWIYRQYDHQVQTNTVIGPGSDAGVLRVKGTKKAIALTTDANGKYCYLDPYQGGAMAVAEAARNLICSGAEPVALTNCLNFGNPEKPDIYYQLKECIRGMARACRVLKVPVISGNVSLFNETRGRAVYPTPVVGMLGLLADVEKRCSLGFSREGDEVFLLGWEESTASRALAGSEYLEKFHGTVAGRPAIDLEQERRLQRCCLRGIRAGLVRSAHDCSEGGLLVALAECSVAGGLGFEGEVWGAPARRDVALFGEAPSRIVVTIEPGRRGELVALAESEGVPVKMLGTVGGQRLVVPGLVDLRLSALERAWRGGLEAALTSGK